MLVAGALAPLAAAASTPATLYVSAKAKLEPACSVASAKKPFQTIAGALACAATGDTIKVGAGTFAGGFTIPVGVVIDGDGANRTTIAEPDQHLSSPLVSVAPGLNTTIENIAVNGSEEADGKNNNGGILDSGGSLTLSQVAISRIAGTGEGADAPVTVAPHSGTATLTVLDSTISNGFGTWGGGAIYASAARPRHPSTSRWPTPRSRSRGTSATRAASCSGTRTSPPATTRSPPTSAARPAGSRWKSEARQRSPIR